MSDTVISLVTRRPTLNDSLNVKSTTWMALERQSMSDSKIRYFLSFGFLTLSK